MIFLEILHKTLLLAEDNDKTMLLHLFLCHCHHASSGSTNGSSAQLTVAIIGGLVAITAAILGYWFTKSNNATLQIRKLKEEHYIAYIDAIHENIENSSLAKYVKARNKVFLIASEEVIKKMLLFEKGIDERDNDIHDDNLTALIKAIRIDLKIKDENFPKIGFKKSTR